jgi:hypothetical protein
MYNNSFTYEINNVVLFVTNVCFLIHNHNGTEYSVLVITLQILKQENKNTLRLLQTETVDCSHDLSNSFPFLNETHTAGHIQESTVSNKKETILHPFYTEQSLSASVPLLINRLSDVPYLMENAHLFWSLNTCNEVLSKELLSIYFI